MSLGIYIKQHSLVCNLGHQEEEIWTGLLNGKGNFSEKKGIFGAHLSADSEIALEEISKQAQFRKCDRTVHLLLLAANQLELNQINEQAGLQVASSRGATQLWEEEHERMLNSGQTTTSASPITTLGNVGSNLAQYLKLKGLVAEQSNTCSSSGIALANAIAWLKADFAEEVLVGASESALSPFTMAQMKAMKLLSEDRDAYPVKSLDLNKTKNTLVLGEAAGLVQLASTRSTSSDVEIAGLGWSKEQIKSPSFLSPDAEGLSRSMKMALDQAGIQKPDLIIAHAPGTLLGDRAEMRAINACFGKNHQIPVFSNKFLLGHSFGASGIASLINGCLSLQRQFFTDQPHLDLQGGKKEINSILINSIGFGGQAVSLALRK